MDILDYDQAYSMTCAMGKKKVAETLSSRCC